MRYAYGVTALLLLSGSAFALSTGDPGNAGGLVPAAVALVQTGIAPKGAPDSFADLVEQLQPAVVNIATKQKVEVVAGINPFTGEKVTQKQEQQSGGSGFIISTDGYIVTNNHVVAGGPDGKAVDRVTVTLFDGKEYTAKIVGRDPTSDVALLKIDATSLPFVEMESSAKNRVGDWVIAIGNPLGLSSTVTAGIISALQRNIGAGGAYDRFIQTDTAINPGNSGGPLFNIQGKVIGINNRLISPIGANIGVGFAIPAEEALPVIESLKKGVRPERGYLGIAIQAVNERLADSLGIPKNRGEEVTNVIAGQPGEKSGLKEGDIVMKVNGREVTPDMTLSRIVASIKPNSKIPLEILREGKTMTINATVGARPTEEEMAKSSFDPEEQKEFQGDVAEGDAKLLRDALGISVIPMDASIARRLGLPADTRGLVVDIAGTGSAAQVGVQRVDIIVAANYQPINSVADLVAALKKAKSENKSNILLGIRRRGGPAQNVAVGIDD